MNLAHVKSIRGKLATENLVPRKKVYGERLVKDKGKEYRIWDLYRSKLAAAIKNGLEQVPLDEDSNVLYLGAGNGTTPSHVSDICSNGNVYALEFSSKSAVDLYALSEQRKNLVPILADAKKPHEYMNRIPAVDVIYQDVAQKDQASILKKNAEYFLKPDGYAFIMVKARSVDVTKKPETVFNMVSSDLRSHFNIIEKIVLDPYEEDHMCILVQLRPGFNTVDQ